jgi:hypothetical protein
MNATADAVLVVHFLFVLFVLGGFVLIVAGGALGWQWVRNRRFRQLHLAAIVFVALESLAGIACPLTVWEDSLRRAAPHGQSFVGRWVAGLLYYHLPEWVFTTAYVAFAAAVFLAWRWVRPRPA